MVKHVTKEGAITLDSHGGESVEKKVARRKDLQEEKLQG